MAQWLWCVNSKQNIVSSLVRYKIATVRDNSSYWANVYSFQIQFKINHHFQELQFGFKSSPSKFSLLVLSIVLLFCYV